VIVVPVLRTPPPPSVIVMPELADTTATPAPVATLQAVEP